MAKKCLFYKFFCSSVCLWKINLNINQPYMMSHSSPFLIQLFYPPGTTNSLNNEIQQVIQIIFEFTSICEPCKSYIGEIYQPTRFFTRQGGGDRTNGHPRQDQTGEEPLPSTKFRRAAQPPLAWTSRNTLDFGPTLPPHLPLSFHPNNLNLVR